MIQHFLSLPVVRASYMYLIIVLITLVCAVVLRPVMAPLVLSFILYSQLEPLTNKLLKHGMPESTAISVILFGLIALIVLCVVLLFPMLFDQFSSLQERLPIIWAELTRIAYNAVDMANQKLHLNLDLNNLIAKFYKNAEEWGTSTVISSAGFAIDLAVVILLIPIVTFFLMRDYSGMRNRMLGWLPNRSFELGCLIYYRVTEQLQKYIRGVLVQSGIVALICCVGFYIMDVEMAITFGLMAGLFNLIPYVGPVLAIVPPALMMLGAGADIWSVAGVAGVVLIAQLFDNLVTVPVFIANTVGLHSLVVLLGVIVFGYFFGFIGMLIAIPVLATSKIVFMGFLRGLHGSPGPAR